MSAQPTAGSPSTTTTTTGQSYQRRQSRMAAVWAIIVVVVAIAAGLGGYYYGKSTATSTSKVTVTYYDDLASSEEGFMTNVLIPNFESIYPNININYQNIAAGSMVTKIQALVTGNDVGTTLIAEDNLDIGELIYGANGQNYLMNLNSSTNPIAPNIQPANMIPSMTEVTNYEQTAFGGQYFIPFRANTPLVWLNATAARAVGITAPPQSFTDLLTDANLLGSTSVQFQGGAGDDTATEMFQWDVQFGGNPMVYNDFGDLQAMSYVYNLSKDFNPGSAQGTYEQYSGLGTGAYSILDYQWPYVYPLLTGGNSSFPAMNSNTLWVYPGPNGSGSHAAAHVIGGDVLAIPSGATNLWAIQLFAQYLLSAHAQQVLMVDTGNPAVNAAAYENLPSNQSVVDAAILQALENPVFRPPVPWIETWVTTFYDDIYTPYILNGNGAGAWSALVTDANTANAAMESYLSSSVSASAASTYAAGGYGPLYV
jgi:trehalose transport system substrate-binding protein